MGELKVTDDVSILGPVANLLTIDAKVGGGNQAFAFIGTAAFSASGQVRYVQSVLGFSWALIRPLVETYPTLTRDIREMVNGCLYLAAEGCRRGPGDRQRPRLSAAKQSTCRASATETRFQHRL